MQEEMDWLVYAAYGLLPADSPALGQALSPPPLAREQRPFVLWAKADGDFEKAVGLIPAEWPEGRRALWQARLEAVRDSEHIRRIEQPVYKRRWDEQWKVGNRWQCGPVAYDAEFVDAFDWWLSEKAEWWLEKKKSGGPVSLDEWTAALQQNTRVQAAWDIVMRHWHVWGSGQISIAILRLWSRNRVSRMTSPLLSLGMNWRRSARSPLPSNASAAS